MTVKKTNNPNLQINTSGEESNVACANKALGKVAKTIEKEKNKHRRNKKREKKQKKNRNKKQNFNFLEE